MYLLTDHGKNRTTDVILLCSCACRKRSMGALYFHHKAPLSHLTSPRLHHPLFLHPSPPRMHPIPSVPYPHPSSRPECWGCID